MVAGPLGPVEAVADDVVAVVVARDDRVPVDHGVPAAGLRVHGGPQLEPGAAQPAGERARGGQGLRGPAEVHEHRVRDLPGPVLEELLVELVERALPAHPAGGVHGVVPGDAQTVRLARRPQGAQELPHPGGQRAVPAVRLGVHEPAVEAVRPRHLDELVRDREAAEGVALHQVAGPPEVAAVGDGRQEHVAQHPDPVAVGGVDHGRVRGEHDPLAGGAAPEDQLVDVRPVRERVVVGRRGALGRVPGGGPEGDEGGDPGLAGAGVPVRRDRSEPLCQGHGRGVVRQIGVALRGPPSERTPHDPGAGGPRREGVREPVGGVRGQVCLLYTWWSPSR